MKIRELRPLFSIPALLLIVLLGGNLAAWAAPAGTATSLAMTAGGKPVASGGSIPSGDKLTLTATVTAGGARITTGQVFFCDASAKSCTDVHLLGTVPLTGTGTAVLTFIPGIGSHSYKAVFAGTPNGATNYAGSASSNSALTVTGTNPTTTTIAASGNPGNYTLKATVAGMGVAPDFGALSGTVSFPDTSDGNLSLGTANLGTATIGLNFVNSSTITTGDLAWSVVTADFNGDGISDLAVANYGAGTVSILLGKGDGTFTSATNSPITVTFDPLAIVSGDFNGDGKADLAMENSYYSGVVTILLGNGDGTFLPAPNSPIATGGPFQTPGALALGDWNGDGKQDLVATNSDNVGTDPGTMMVLLGNGDGTFTPTPNSPVTVGSGPISIASGDLNGDGVPDLAIGNFDGNNLTILLGTGDGTFTQAANSPIAVGSFPTSVAIGDFNRDGKPDLAVANSNYTSGIPGSVTILQGNGNGTFTQAANSPISVGNDTWAVVVGDFNGDGKTDLGLANNGDDTVTVLLGDGDGTFAQATNSPIRVGDFPQAAAAADFSGDGISDLAVMNSGVGTASVLLSQVTQTATATATGISPVGTGTHNVEASYPGNNSFAPSTSATVALTGIAPNPSFTVSGTAVTLSAAGTTTANTSTVTVTPAGGFTGSVQLTAAITSSPAGALNLPTLSFGSSSPISIAGTRPGTAVLTVTTTPATSSALASQSPLSGIRWYAEGGVTLASVLLFGIPGRRRRWRTLFGVLALLAISASGIAGCGGGANGTGGGTGNPGTTAGTYTVTVTGTSGMTKSKCAISITLQ